MKKLLACLVCVVVAGCAAQVVSTSPRSVIVDANSQGMAAVQQIADAECKKHGRFARLVNAPRFGNNNYLFDCVE
jgi:hypothetical protein